MPPLYVLTILFFEIRFARTFVFCMLVCTGASLSLLLHGWLSVLLHHSTSEKIRRLTSNVFESFATHADHVYDVSDTDCKVHNDSTHAFATFKNRFKKREK